MKQVLTIILILFACGAQSLTLAAMGSDEAEMFKNRIKSYDNVVLVCIYHEQLTERPLPEKHRYLKSDYQTANIKFHPMKLPNI